MNTQTLEHYTVNPARVDVPARTPATARGRALYTVSWFLNGVATQQNYDNPRLSIEEIPDVYA